MRARVAPNQDGGPGGGGQQQRHGHATLHRVWECGPGSHLIRMVAQVVVASSSATVTQHYIGFGNAGQGRT